jgi:hypothetical protein
LLTHPDINEGETVHGRFVGNWETKDTSRTSFCVTNVDAQLVLPEMNWRLPKRKSSVRVSPGSVQLSLDQVEVPEHLEAVFANPNHGTVDVKHRLYRSVFALSADLSFAYSASDGYLELPPAQMLLMTMGNVEKGGALTASGLGRILSGAFSGLMFACGHPTKPPRCGDKYTDGRLCTKKKGHGGRHFNPLRPRVSWA